MNNNYPQLKSVDFLPYSYTTQLNNQNNSSEDELKKRENVFSGPPKAKRVILASDSIESGRQSPSMQNHLTTLSENLEHPS
jgi:hypothetical protein